MHDRYEIRNWDREIGSAPDICKNVGQVFLSNAGKWSTAKLSDGPEGKDMMVSCMRTR